MNSLDDEFIDYSLLNDYDLKYLKENKIIPISSYDIYTRFAVCTTSKIDSLNEKSIKTFKVKEEELLFYLSNLLMLYNLHTLLQSVNEKDMSDFFSLLLKFAISKNTSDIHFESSTESFVIRFRIDGSLRIFFRYKKKYFFKISSFVKLQSKLDLTLIRLPQNGRFSLAINKMKYDFRVSFMPTILGESLVIRILNEFTIEKELNKIGFLKNNLTLIKNSISEHRGLILVTGPTGSGKTTTLYSILNELNNSSRKIITVEDPIEYQIKGIQQISINEEIGLGFSEILKDILRQDPDIILIGEIRDEKSLSLAMQAALTGHLVLSTLHTNDSISTINRLFDLKAKSFLISDTLKTIISQRLVLKLCTCIKGCEACNFTKFKGRVMISEVLCINQHLSNMINKKKSYLEFKKYLETKEFKTIEDDAKEKIKLNLTTYEEVYKVL